MSDLQGCLAVIPARGGSKGLPGKNLRHLAGRSLLARSVSTARRARHVARVVVTTDDGAIAAEARRHGAEVVARPAELAGDAASSESALLHALDQLEADGGPLPEITVFLQCTAPLTLPADVDATVDALLAEGADSAFAAVPFHGFLWRRGDDGEARAVDHDAGHRPRRQERPPRYVEAGSVYAFRTAGFRTHRHRFFGRTALHPLPAERWLEVDTPGDLERARRLLASDRPEDRGGNTLAEILAGALPDPLEAVVLDFDGVLTDNRVLVAGDGGEAVLCHRGDGHGLERLGRAGAALLILSRETDPVVGARARKLGIPALTGELDKHATLDGWLAERGLTWGGTVFVGNDLPDVACLEAAGCGVAVADAHPRARSAARVVLGRRGGHGAVRELADAVLAVLEQRRGRGQGEGRGEGRGEDR